VTSACAASGASCFIRELEIVQRGLNESITPIFSSRVFRFFCLVSRAPSKFRLKSPTISFPQNSIRWLFLFLPYSNVDQRFSCIYLHKYENVISFLTITRVDLLVVIAVHQIGVLFILFFLITPCLFVYSAVPINLVNTLSITAAVTEPTSSRQFNILSDIFRIIAYVAENI
jgi:hypothetical protein